VSRGRAGLAALAALALALGCAPEPPPSLVLVTLDTLRRDHVGVYGDPRGLTPHLDALAADGRVHERAFTTMPTTAPAHASLFTGQMPREHGVLRNGDPLPAEAAERELAVRLRARGYATAAFVTTRLLAADVTGLRGFEIHDAPRGVLRHGADAVEAALAWLDAERRRPVFLWVHVYDPHAPYGTADEKRRSFPVEPSRYGWVDPERYADPDERRAMAQRYARGVRAADAALGALVAGVRAQLARPPLWVVASDHGESLDEHLDTRGFAYDHGEFLDPEGVEIPLVVAGPGVVPGRGATPASLRDVYATLLAAAGAEDVPSAGTLRDLRAAADGPRVVTVERRRFGRPQPEAVRAHAAAASDGRRLVVVGEKGRATDPEAPAALLAAARSALPGADEPAPRRDLAPATAEALRALGYGD